MAMGARIKIGLMIPTLAVVVIIEATQQAWGWVAVTLVLLLVFAAWLFSDNRERRRSE